MNYDDLMGLHVVEWSNNQRCGHLTTVAEMLFTNRNSLTRNVDPGFIPVAIFKSREEALEFYGEFTEAIKTK